MTSENTVSRDVQQDDNNSTAESQTENTTPVASDQNTASVGETGTDSAAVTAPEQAAETPAATDSSTEAASKPETKQSNAPTAEAIDNGAPAPPAADTSETKVEVIDQSTDAESSSQSDQPEPAEESTPRKVKLNPTVDPAAVKAVPSIDAPAEQQVSAAEGKPIPATKLPTGEAAAPVEIPSDKEEQLDANLEAEIEAAMSGTAGSTTESPAELSADVPAPTLSDEALEPGNRVKGKVQSIHADNVFLDVGHRMSAVVSLRQFGSGKHPAVNQEVEVVIDRIDENEGLIHVSLPRAARKVGGDWSVLSKGQVVECLVTKTNKGGLEVSVSNLRGFMPAGQVDIHFVADLEPYIGQKLRAEIIECNPKKRNLVLSHRAVLNAERAETAEKLWETLAEGATCSGVVKTIKDYGAFVDIGGIDGFLHIGEISWTRLKHPTEALSEGQHVDVKILTIDKEKQKVGLGMRQLSQNPWSGVTERFPVGSKVNGKVTRVTKFGAFVELEPGVEGLVHISELDHRRVNQVSDVLQVGQEIEAQILEVDPNRKRIGLSLKALISKPEPEPKSEKEIAEEKAVAEAERKKQQKRQSQLKGGVAGKSGESSGQTGLFGDPRNFK